MKDIAHIRHVAEHYPSLQGLRLVPFGLLFVLWGLNDILAFWPTYYVWRPMISIVTIGAAAAASVAIGRFYYDARFGRMKPHKQPWGALWIFVVWFVASPVSWVLMREHQLHFDLFGLVSVAALGAYWWYMYGPSWYDGVILAGLVLLCILPLFAQSPLHGHPDVPGALSIEVYKLSVGFVMIASGIGAHLYLKRALPLPAAEEMP